MISELGRFLSGPSRQRRTALLARRLFREAQRCQRALEQPLLPTDYRQQLRLLEAITAAHNILKNMNN